MSTTVYNRDHHDDDGVDDNMSDEEEWSRNTARIADQCSSALRRDDYYYRPTDFYPEHVTYGDGGAATLDFPVWIWDRLSENDGGLGSNVRQELLEVFYALNDKRKDFHKYPSPVEDIIDPDLLVCKPIQPRPPPPTPGGPYYGNYDRNACDICNKWNYDPSTLRGSYQWIPSDFRICHDSNGKCEVHIETPISHLPMTEEFDQTYRNLEKVFTKLVPMFGEVLHFDQQKGDTRLQVIVKVQSYHLQPTMKYSGRWHTEGRTEHIQATGVYYLYIDDGLEGGALKFRPAVAPEKCFAYGGDFDIDRFLMPETDTAIVFDNSLPHRFCSIRNSTSIARRRTFLNFFVVSPQYPITGMTISNLPLVSYQRCWNLLTCIVDENDQRKLPDVAIEKILSFLKKMMWESDSDAQEFRARVKHEMIREPTGWGGTDYGNCGEIAFIKSKIDMDFKEAQGLYDNGFRLDHTESE